MTVFVDTSALLAFLDASDRHHAGAVASFTRLLESGTDVVTTNYVVLETHALLQHRFGLDAVRDFVEDLVPVFRIRWVDAELHARAVTALLTARRRKLSLVDCASFAVMHEDAIHIALAYDADFTTRGFEAYGA